MPTLLQGCVWSFSMLCQIQPPLGVASGAHSIHRAHLESQDTPQLLNKQGFWAFTTPSVTWTFPD